jgi:hypothetical protein
MSTDREEEEMKPSTLVKLAIIVLVLGVFVQLGGLKEKSWATTDQDAERQTVPTRTHTPQPVSPTVPPPTVTDTFVPPPATDTATPLPSETVTPTLSPTPSITVTVTITATEATSSVPSVLPQAGSDGWWLVGGVLLFAHGLLLLLAGIRAQRHNL